jgi:hypothetical protein
MSQIFDHCDKYNQFYGKILNGKSKNKLVQMEIKLSSCDAMSPSHSKMVKNFIADAEMTELLQFKH